MRELNLEEMELVNGASILSVLWDLAVAVAGTLKDSGPL